MDQRPSSHARRIFDHLVRCAGEMRTVSYGELGEMCGLHHRALRVPLYDILEGCRRRGLPTLTALVVYADTRRPGDGLWPADLPEADREAWWRAEVTRVFAYDWDTVEFDTGETHDQG